MPWLDAVMLGLLLLSTLVGVVRGLVSEIMSLLGWLVAYVVARLFSAEIAPLIPIGEPGSALNFGAAFASVFIGTLIFWAICSWLIRMLIRASPLSGVDRLLGALFGLVRGIVLLLAVAIVVNLTTLSKSASWHDSVGAHWLDSALASLRPWLPPQLSERLPA
jgi:membrane protein required for colicin V production